MKSHLKEYQVILKTVPNSSKTVWNARMIQTAVKNNSKSRKNLSRIFNRTKASQNLR